MKMRVKIKESELEKVGGAFLTYLRTEVWFGPGTDAAPLLSLCELLRLSWIQLPSITALVGASFSMLTLLH